MKLSGGRRGRMTRPVGSVWPRLTDCSGLLGHRAGNAFYGGDDEPEWRFDEKGRPVERMGRRQAPSDDEAA